jgi:imidazole glycerol-phosphate synthase subunit HisF
MTKTHITRIIPVLFIKNGLIVRSQFFKRHQIIGNVIDQASRLNDWNADELIYIDISRDKFYDSRRDDIRVKSKKNIIDIIKEISKVCFMPISVGGNIRTVEDALIRIRNGADKIIINYLLFNDLNTLKKIITILGTQAVVGSLDYKIINGSAIIHTNYGTESKAITLKNMAKRCEDFGVGELFLQNIDLDGSAKGFDIENIKSVVEKVNIPVIACSGAGSINHFVEAVNIDHLFAVAAGNIFNFKERAYPMIKEELKDRSINVR